ncbi:unnamed protein product, partial [Iphiclides podalirius]
MRIASSANGGRGNGNSAFWREGARAQRAQDGRRTSGKRAQSEVAPLRAYARVNNTLCFSALLCVATV